VELEPGSSLKSFNRSYAGFDRWRISQERAEDLRPAAAELRDGSALRS